MKLKNYESLFLLNRNLILSDDLVTAFDDSKEHDILEKSPDIDSDDISIFSFLKVESLLHFFCRVNFNGIVERERQFRK